MKGLFILAMDTQLKLLYDTYLKNPNISTDSRKISSGSIFFALKGPSFDGNKYAKDAIQKGARIAVIDDENYKLDENYILVDDVLKTLQLLGKHHRIQLDIPIIGITGSNGKTTTKELVNQVLSKKFNVLATAGNLNNHIGVPLTLLSLNNEHEIGIIEMGSNGKGEIEFLCDLCLPDYALITSIGKAHLEGFGDIAGVVAEKTALYRSAASRSKTIFYNEDSRYLKESLPTNTENIRYSQEQGHLFTYHHKSTFPYISGSCHRGEQSLELESKMYGAYNVANMISALSIGTYFDVEFEKAVAAINEYIPSNNRSELKIHRGAKVFLDAYNANPTSVSLVLDEFSKSQGAKVLVLGDMLEIGDNELGEHVSILNQIDSSKFDTVILFGSMYKSFQSQFSNFKFYDKFEELKDYFDELECSDKNILLKGSRGMGLERLIRS